MPREIRVYRISNDSARIIPKSTEGNGSQTPHSSKKSLSILVALFTILHLLGLWAWISARAQNRFLYQSVNVNVLELPKADPTIARFTDVILQFPCEFLTLPSCSDPVSPEPRSVRRLRKALGDLEDSEYLRGFRDYKRLLIYILDAGLREDFEDLVAAGLLTQTYERQLELLRLTSTWHFAASLSYWFLNRHQDAVVAFEEFAFTGTQVSREGYWISLSGLDLTDVAVIAHTFCRQQDKLNRHRCLFGFLHAVASQLPFEGEGLDLYRDAESAIRWHLQEETMQVAQAYGALPGNVRDTELELYLRAAEQLSDYGVIDSELVEGMAKMQDRPRRAAVFYLLGRSGVLQGGASADTEACLEAVDFARRAFEASITEDELGIFSGPAKRKLRSLPRLKSGCEK